MSISNFLIDFKKTIENPTLLPRVNMDLTLLINKHIENKTCIEDFNKLVIDENIRNKFTGIMICDIKKNDLQTYIQHVYTYLSIYDIVEEEKNIWEKGGSHYKNFEIQPSKFINKNKLQLAEGNVEKYVCRHKIKGKKEDIKKAMHYLQMILERDYD